jgi:hypothetical protein
VKIRVYDVPAAGTTASDVMNDAYVLGCVEFDGADIGGSLTHLSLLDLQGNVASKSTNTIACER